MYAFILLLLNVGHSTDSTTTPCFVGDQCEAQATCMANANVKQKCRMMSWANNRLCYQMLLPARFDNNVATWQTGSQKQAAADLGHDHVMWCPHGNNLDSSFDQFYPKPDTPQGGQYFALSCTPLYRGACCAQKADRTLDCFTEGREARFQRFKDSAPTTPVLDFECAGEMHCGAVMDDGTLYRWQQQYRAGRSDWYDSWRTLPTDDGYKTIAFNGRLGGCALKATGLATCWGNTHMEAKSLPEDVQFTMITAIQGNGYCGIKASDGSILCRGGNPEYFRAGSNTRRYGLPPTGTGFTDIECGSQYCCAYGADHVLQCWGRSAYNWRREPYDFDVPTEGRAICMAINGADKNCVGMKTEGYAPNTEWRPHGGSHAAWGTADDTRRADGMSIHCWGSQNTRIGKDWIYKGYALPPPATPSANCPPAPTCPTCATCEVCAPQIPCPAPPGCPQCAALAACPASSEESVGDDTQTSPLAAAALPSSSSPNLVYLLAALGIFYTGFATGKYYGKGESGVYQDVDES